MGISNCSRNSSIVFTDQTAFNILACIYNKNIQNFKEFCDIPLYFFAIKYQIELQICLINSISAHAEQTIIATVELCDEKIHNCRLFPIERLLFEVGIRSSFSLFIHPILRKKCSNRAVIYL